MIDFKMIPDSELKTIIVRLLIYLNVQTEKINQDKLLTLICNFANYDLADVDTYCRSVSWK